MKKNKKERFLEKAKDKLFRAVGFDGFSQSFVDAYPYNWYHQREWNVEQEAEFKKWFTDECTKVFNHSKRHAQSEASWFVFSYGWKVKEKDNSVNLQDYCEKDNTDYL